MVRETAVTSQELADLYRDCATNIEESWRMAMWLSQRARCDWPVVAESTSRRGRLRPYVHGTLFWGRKVAACSQL